MPKRRTIKPPLDAVTELVLIKEIRKLKQHRRRRYSSKLDQHRSEILALRAAGGSCADVVVYLAGQRIRVVESTVRRWLHAAGLATQADAAAAIAKAAERRYGQSQAEQLELTDEISDLSRSVKKGEEGGDHGQR